MRPQDETDAAFQRAAFVARESYGRLVAYLATRWGDLAAAEDAWAQPSSLRLSVGRRLACRNDRKAGSLRWRAAS